MTLAQQLGKRLLYLRQQKGWSQLTLAIESGVNRNYLSDLERGSRNPTLVILSRLADALEVDLSTLLKGIKSIK
jgi:transcriptional regulator with XRE-family HTH domain